MSQIRVQERVSRPYSIRETLSRLAWQQGVACFFTQNVPFSYSAGSDFAKKIADAMAFFIQEASIQGPIGWVELGSGLGLLGRHLMDALQGHHADIYEASQFLLTDYTRPLVETLDQSGLFSPHRSRVHFSQVDANYPVFNETIPAHITWMSYLLDSLDTCHIEVREGHIFELYVQTDIAKTAKILDARTLPPRIREAEDIALLLRLGTEEDFQILGPMLQKNLCETLVPVALDDTDGSQEWKQHLKEAVHAMAFPKDGTYRFNVSPAAKTILDRWVSQTPDRAILMLNDFGYLHEKTCPPPEKLTTGYGAVSCHSVYFPYLEFLAKQRGLRMWTTQYKEGNTQVAFIIKGDISDTCIQVFDALFKDAGYDYIQSIVDQILAFKDSPEENLKQTTMIWEQLSDIEKQDYLLGITCTAACLDDGKYKAALWFANQIPHSYDAMGVATYQLMGKAHKGLGQFDQAVFYFKLALSIAPGLGAIHSQLAQVALTKEDYEVYLTHAIAFVTASREWVIWEQLITIAMVQTKLGQYHQARHLCRWLESSAQRYPDIIPESVKNKATTLLDTFLKAGKRTSS